MLLCAVVGSGIMGERLAAGNLAIALLANSIATGGALAALILIFGPISGAHLNPVVNSPELDLLMLRHSSWPKSWAPELRRCCFDGSMMNRNQYE